MLEDLYLLSRRILDVQERLYKRSLLTSHAFQHRLSLLIGQRGVGKTTLLVQYLLQYVAEDKLSAKILYLPLDHFLLENYSIYEIAEQFQSIGGEIMAIDEIHKYSNWSKELKSIYDTYPNLKIIASGSSALKIYEGPHDLSRRAIVTNISGLSFREYLELTLNIAIPKITLEQIINQHEQIAHKIVEVLLKEKRRVLNEFHNYLQIGYFPYYQELNDKILYYMTLQQNLHAAIDSDLVAVYPSLTGNSVKKIKQLLGFIAQAVPFKPNWHNLKQLLDVGDTRTIKTYFKYLEDVGIVRTVTKAGAKIDTISDIEKVYLNNPNEFYALAADNSNLGSIRETFLLCMLAVNHTTVSPMRGDFLVDDYYLLEVGGKNKDPKQRKGYDNGYLVCDNIEFGIKRKIPLWLFGLIY